MIIRQPPCASCVGVYSKGSHTFTAKTFFEKLQPAGDGEAHSKLAPAESFSAVNNSHLFYSLLE